MSTVDELHERWSRQADYREAYEALGPEFAVARALIEARTRAGFSQVELAARMKTTQSVGGRADGERPDPALDVDAGKGGPGDGHAAPDSLRTCVM